MPKSLRQSGLPTPQQILTFLEKSREPVGKREIAKAFGLKAAEKIALKALLKDMAEEGLIDGAKSAYHRSGGLPKVTVLRVADIDGSTPVAVPERWEAEGIPPPRVLVIEKGRRSALGVGDRILARIEGAGAGYRAHPIRKLEAGAEEAMGVLAAETGPGGKAQLWLRSIDKRQRRDYLVSDAGDAAAGDLVLAAIAGRPPRQTVKVTQRLADPLAPRSLSLIAIHKYNLPHSFTDEVEGEAQTASKLPLDAAKREDLRHLPILAIDPRDARDHDDAIWAAPRDDGGYDAIVAIADVSFYVRPGGALDREARRRGNSVYFPDQVVPMLPHSLSSDMCSLKAGEDRAALACHLVIDKGGKVTSWRFTRALVRLAANIAYEDAQAMVDADSPLPLAGGAGGGPEQAQTSNRPTPNPSRKREGAVLLPALRHLYAAWALLAKARADRAPLDLDLPERQVILDDAGRIAEIKVRERLDAHRLVEDFMIAANVAAAKALEAKKAPVMYRVHEAPAREKLVTLKEFLATYDVSFALGQVITPALFNKLLKKFEEPENRQRVMEQVLRTQTQAYYSPANAGHFGLALGSYGHFTSPIRRYADLLVHRSLVGTFGLEQPKPKDLPPTTALPAADAAAMARIGEVISQAERRAMEAERETIDRYVAAYLSEKVGEVLPTRITGVQSFGFFAQVDGLGGDGLVPAATLGDEYFRWDEAAQTLTGEHNGTQFKSGQRLELRLTEANPLTGSLMFALPDAPAGEGNSRFPSRHGRTRPGARSPGKRGRPGNIRHQGKRR
jgi:ribonuclease R